MHNQEDEAYPHGHCQKARNALFNKSFTQAQRRPRPLDDLLPRRPRSEDIVW